MPARCWSSSTMRPAAWATGGAKVEEKDRLLGKLKDICRGAGGGLSERCVLALSGGGAGVICLNSRSTNRRHVGFRRSSGNVACWHERTSQAGGSISALT